VARGRKALPKYFSTQDLFLAAELKRGKKFGQTCGKGCKYVKDSFKPRLLLTLLLTPIVDDWRGYVIRHNDVN